MAARPRQEPATQRRGELLCQLLDRDGSKLRSQARLHAQRPPDAEDALQDACVQFIRYYDGPPADALRWMYVVVKRCAWAIGRRASRSRELGYDVWPASGEGEERELLSVDDGGTAEAVERQEASSERLALLTYLKPDERRALLLLALGYSYKEIATRNGWTFTKVNRCIAEGRAALRGRLASKGER